MLVGKWAETDPQAAVEFALTSECMAHSDVTRAAINAWVVANPQAAMAWAQSLPVGGPRNNALYALAAALGKRDPAAAMQFIGTLPKDQFNDIAYNHLFGAWASQDPVAAGHQALTLPRGPNRDNAVRMTVWDWAKNDPQAALAWAGQLPDARERRDALTAAYQRWAGADPQAASAAVLALPPGELSNRVLGGRKSRRSRRARGTPPHRADAGRECAKRCDGNDFPALGGSGLGHDRELAGNPARRTFARCCGQRLHRPCCRDRS